MQYQPKLTQVGFLLWALDVYAESLCDIVLTSSSGTNEIYVHDDKRQRTGNTQRNKHELLRQNDVLT